VPDYQTFNRFIKNQLSWLRYSDVHSAAEPERIRSTCSPRSHHAWFAAVPGLLKLRCPQLPVFSVPGPEKIRWVQEFRASFAEVKATTGVQATPNAHSVTVLAGQQMHCHVPAAVEKE